MDEIRLLEKKAKVNQITINPKVLEMEDSDDEDEDAGV